MTKSDLKPLFEYLDEFRSEVNTRFDKLEGKVDSLQTAVDNLALMVKGFQEEMIANRRRIDILEEWAKKVAEKTGIPLPF